MSNWDVQSVYCVQLHLCVVNSIQQYTELNHTLDLRIVVTQLRGITNLGLTLLGSLCVINDAGVNGCAVHDGMTQNDAIFWILSTYFISRLYTHYGRKATDKTVASRIRLSSFHVWCNCIINVGRFLRNHSQFCVFIVVFVLSASKLIRNGYSYLRSMKSVKSSCPLLSENK
jgi:hypothetical protein